MKHLVVISLLLLAAAPALAQDRAPAGKVVILKTTSDQRALTELLSARIKSALLGETYIPVQACKGRDCQVSAE